MPNHVAREPNGQFAAESIASVYESLARETRRIDEALDAEVRRIDGLRQADQVSLQAALTAAKTAVDAALAAAEKAVAAALIAAKEAVNKAEAAQQRTNEGQNEFRGQLKDQAATLLPRTEYALAHRALEEKVADHDRQLGDIRSRLDVGPPSLSVLQKESDRQTGRTEGSSASWSTILAVAAASGGIAAAVITIMGLIK